MTLPGMRFLFRPFRRNLTYTVINLLGLAMGLTCAFFILLYVSREYSFDRNQVNRNSVYRILSIYRDFDWKMPLAPYPLGPALLASYPDVAAVTRVDRQDMIIHQGDKSLRTRNILAVDPAVKDIFTFHFIEGSGSRLFDDPNRIALSSSFAGNLFPGGNCVGQVIECEIGEQKVQMTVSAVYEDFPETCTFRPQGLIPVKWTLEPMEKDFNDPDFASRYDQFYYQTYIRLKSGVDPDRFRTLLQEAGRKYIPEKSHVSLDMQRLSDIYLHSEDIVNNRTQSGDLGKIRVFSLIGVLILLVAAFNYIILSTARSALRYREIGMRKVSGATRGALSRQIFGESLLIALFALPIAFVAMLLLLPTVNRMFGLHLVYTLHEQWLPTLVFAGICLATGILSGSYLALYLARLNPVEILRNRVHLSGRNSLFYKSLVVVQVVIFMGLLSASGLIFHQISHVSAMNLGIDRENLVIVNTSPRKIADPLPFIDEIRKSPLIVNASNATFCPPAYSKSVSNLPRFDDPSAMVAVESLPVGMNFIETLGLQVVQGRSFSPDYPGDRDNSAIINETAVRELGMKGDPVGQKLGDRTIIGVIRDFNLHSAREKVPPLRMSLSDKYIYEVPVRLKAGRTLEGLDFLKAEWERFVPGQPLEYVFFDDAVAGMYSSDRDFGRNIRVFTTIAALIALLGLFGLSLFMASRRTREIGIRKINGAGTGDILLLLDRGFVVLVVLAFVISVPLTARVMENWLAGFAFRAPVGVWVYLKSGLVALAVVLATVSIHAWRAARANPADAVRSE
jgi:putative ABC transport system permease protein